MREIKFRVWDNKHDCMYLPDIFSEKIVIQLGGVIGLFNGSTYDTISRDRFVLEQFTGLRDKNGTEIYEGDIVKAITNKAMVIGWSDKHASFTIEREGWAFRHFFGEAMDGKDCEIIGNIHQNPELLNSKP